MISVFLRLFLAGFIALGIVFYVTDGDVGQVGRAVTTAYGDALARKEKLIAEKAAALETASGKPPLLISGVSGEGVKQALGDIAKHLGVLAETEEEEDPSTSDTPQGWTP